MKTKDVKLWEQNQFPPRCPDCDADYAVIWHQWIAACPVCHKAITLSVFSGKRFNEYIQLFIVALLRELGNIDYATYTIKRIIEGKQ